VQHAEIPGDGLGIAADDEYIDVVMGWQGRDFLHRHVICSIYRVEAMVRGTGCQAVVR
jgi:hypothetical protein